MEKIFIVVFMASVCSATFFSMPISQNTASNVCIYSKDPSQYEPKCFICPQEVYTNSLLACTNGTTMPSNITYSSATCMEKNCAINYPKASTPAPPEPFDSKAFVDYLTSFLNRMTRSISDNDVHESLEVPSSEKRWEIVARVETFASDSDFTELDYNT